jgi:hypothetical protein
MKTPQTYVFDIDLTKKFENMKTQVMIDAIKNKEQDTTVPRLLKCQCEKVSMILMPFEERYQTIHIQEQPCEQCGHYMGKLAKPTLEAYAAHAKRNKSAKP